MEIFLTHTLELNEEPPVIKKRRVERESRDPAPQTEKAPTYQHLTAVTRRVSLQTIEAKWEPLPPGAVERISQLLHDLQRPVVVHLNDDRKRTEANTAMQMVSRRLTSKISKGLPFPRGTRNHRDDDFDFEKILDHNRALEAQLTSALHANKLLEAELSKEAALLVSEKAALVKLETNAKSEAAIRKQSGRKMHSLLLSDDSAMMEDDIKDHIGLRDDHSALPLSLGVSPLFLHSVFFRERLIPYQDDDRLQEVTTELQSHVDTILGNITPVFPIIKTIERTKSAVQATLFDHLDTNQYEDVVLG